MDVIVDDALWEPGTWTGHEILYSWAPEVPADFLAPSDIARRAGLART